MWFLKCVLVYLCTCVLWTALFFPVHFLFIFCLFSVYFERTNIVGADFFIFRRKIFIFRRAYYLPFGAPIFTSQCASRSRKVPNAPAAPLPCRGGVGGGVSIFKGGGVCNSHTEVNILTQRNRGSRGIISRWGAEAFGGLGEYFQSEGVFQSEGGFQSLGSQRP